MYTMESSLGRKLADLASASSSMCPGIIFDPRGVAVVMDGRGAVMAVPVTAAPHAVTVIVSPQALREACGTQSVDVSIDIDCDSVTITAGALRWSHPHDVMGANSLPDWRAAFPALTVARVRHFTVSVEQLRGILAAITTETITITLDRDGLNQPAVIWSGEDGKHVVASLPPHNTVWWWDPAISSRLACTFDKVDVLPQH